MTRVAIRRLMRAMTLRLHHARRGATGLPGRLALVLLLVAPLCAAACGVHLEPERPATADAAHADCHGMAVAHGDRDTHGSGDASDEAARDCCEDHDAALAPEPAPSLPDAVLAFTGLSLEHLVGRVSAPVASLRPEPGGRSPGRLLLLLVLSFLE